MAASNLVNCIYGTRLCLQPRILAYGLRKKATAAPATTIDQKIDATDKSTAKDFSEMPGTSGVLGIMVFLKNFLMKSDVIYKLGIETYYKKYRSDIFRAKLGMLDLVQTRDPNDASQIFRSAGRYPKRFPMDHLLAYYEKANESSSLFSYEGEDWARVRSAVNKRMMRPQMVGMNEDVFSEVANDMIARMRHVRDTDGGGLIIPDMANEMYKWALESISAFLFEQRVGCLKEHAPAESQAFIDAVGTFFAATMKVLGFPHLHQKLNTPIWKQFSSSLDMMFAYARSSIDKKVKKLAAAPLEAEATFLGNLLANDKITRKEVYTTTTELLLAGVDTSSNTLCFALYLLASNPHVQDTLSEEIQSVTKGRAPTAEDFKQMSFLKAVLKESQRIYPVATASARLPEDDIILSGYKVPKGTVCMVDVYAMGRDERFFPDPESFRPSRWLRQQRHPEEIPDPFATLPFGFGVRSCVGRRIAEFEMYILLTKIMQQFKLRLHNNGKLNISQRALLIPGRELPIEFIDRQ